MNEKQILDRLDILAGEASALGSKINRLRNDLIVTRSGKTRASGPPRHTWTKNERAFVQQKAAAGHQPSGIAAMILREFNLEVTEAAVQGQMYRLFPVGHRVGINFV